MLPRWVLLENLCRKNSCVDIGAPPIEDLMRSAEQFFNGLSLALSIFQQERLCRAESESFWYHP